MTEQSIIDVSQQEKVSRWNKSTFWLLKMFLLATPISISQGGEAVRGMKLRIRPTRSMAGQLICFPAASKKVLL